MYFNFPTRSRLIPLFTRRGLWYKQPMTPWYLYILELSDESLYTGITVDLQRRLQQHNEGKASRCTRARRPVRLVFSCEFPDRSAASKEEIRIKKMTRLQKIALIARQPSGHAKTSGP